MIIELGAESFPVTHAALQPRLTTIPEENRHVNAVVHGGAARAAMMEAVLGIQRPIRDIDMCGMDRADPDVVHRLYEFANPGEVDNLGQKPHVFSSVQTLFDRFLDFTINQAVLNLRGDLLLCTETAIGACRERVIRVTDARVAHVVALGESEDPFAQKQFLRDRTGMPARAAYFVAALRAAGHDFSHDLGDLPRPANLDEVHTFYLGLMARKCLQVDEIERGEGDVTATSLLIEGYREIGLTAAETPTKVEDVVAFCEAITAQHPHLEFFGSTVAKLVPHAPKLVPEATN